MAAVPAAAAGTGASEPGLDTLAAIMVRALRDTLAGYACSHGYPRDRYLDVMRQTLTRLSQEDQAP
jgi:hypothetical protein